MSFSESTSKVAIIGGGGHALCLVDLFKRQNSNAVLIGYTDQVASSLDLSFLGDDDSFLRKVAQGEFGPVEKLKLLMGIGINVRLRDKLFKKYTTQGLRFATLVDPSAVVLPSAQIGEGCVIFPQVTVGAFAKIGANVTLHSNAVVEHEALIGEHSYIAPSAVVLGKCKLGARTLVGSNATLLENLVLAEDCTLGAGAVLTRNCLENGVTLKGVPAR